MRYAQPGSGICAVEPESGLEMSWLLGKFRSHAIRRFLKPIHYYWAVDCKRCSFVITLAETRHRPEIERAKSALQGFKAFCPACKRELEYQPKDVIVWSGPPPTPAFIAHPAFAKIREP
jgi:hypothetical protein